MIDWNRSHYTILEWILFISNFAYIKKLISYSLHSLHLSKIHKIMHELQMFLSHRLIPYSTLNIAKTLKCPNDNIVFLCSEKFNFWRVNIKLKKGASEFKFNGFRLIVKLQSG